MSFFRECRAGGRTYIVLCQKYFYVGIWAEMEGCWALFLEQGLAGFDFLGTICRL